MELLTYHAAPDRDLILCPLGDIQFNGTTEDLADHALRDHIAECVGRGGVFVGLGDYIDFPSPSGRAKLRAANLYDNAVDAIEQTAMQLTLRVVEEYLRPTAGSWAAMLSGHHYANLQDGTNSDIMLAGILGVPYGGTCTHLEIDFGDGNVRTIWVHHGEGGGSKSYSPLAKLEAIQGVWDVDLLLMGHMTKLAVSKVPRIYRKGKKLHHRDVALVGCGGWSKAYIEGRRRGNVAQGDYIEKRAANPVVLGAPIITIPCDPAKRIRVEI